MVQVLPGWHIKRGTRLSSDDPGNTLGGGAFGLRFSTELWDEPTSQTMIAADASLSTIGGNSSARIGVGWKMLDMFYAGPETQVYRGDGYSQWRVGAHVTSFKTGNAEWSAAGGWALDTQSRSSPNLRLGFMQRVGGD